eukprot:268796_1
MEHLTNIGSKDRHNKEEMISKASTFWKFLDDLSANDPAAYQEFMYKHKQTQSKIIQSTQNESQHTKPEHDVLQEFDRNIETAKQSLNGTNHTGNQHYFTPIPFMVIKTRINSTKNVVQTLLNVNDRNMMKKGQKLYINFLQSPFCKPLQSKSNPNTQVTDATPISDILVPMQVGNIINEDTVSDDECWRCDVIYHNTIYERFHTQHTHHSTAQLFKKWIIEYALRRTEGSNTITLMRNYKILKKKKFIGKTPPNPQFIADTNTEKKKHKEITHNEETKTDAQTEKDNTNCVLINTECDDGKRKEYIKENASVLIPKYTLNVDKKKQIIKIVIFLDKEQDMKDIELHLNGCKLLLKSIHYKLDLVFPMTIDDRDIKAKFDKNKRCLKLKLPIKT